jgi:hypothetical protein
MLASTRAAGARSSSSSGAHIARIVDGGAPIAAALDPAAHSRRARQPDRRSAAADLATGKGGQGRRRFGAQLSASAAVDPNRSPLLLFGDFFPGFYRGRRLLTEWDTRAVVWRLQ